MSTTPRLGKRRSPRLPSLHHLWLRLNTLPLPEPEDSLLLRILVQALVSVGIIATDVAAADVVDSLAISIWAVPASAVGAAWSWRQRRSRNIPIKFCIAIGMIAALAIFFVNLLSRQEDTRLVLAKLLIQVQVLHSFDLPRRKDLGYSIVIGLILIGVAATLSQTLMFAPMLLLFLAIAIPVLVLDYRSRLGLVPHRKLKLSTDLSLKRLGLVFLVTMALGLTIFACLPRLPGYQLRSFPVSSPIEFQGKFDGATIMNPGYVQSGEAMGNKVGVGSVIGQGTGTLDTNFYYGFNSTINQNLRGEMKPKVVMRVRSQAPGFFRVMAFDCYTGQGWEISRNDDDHIQKIKRPHWTFRFTIPSFPTANRTREIVQSYTVVAELPNIIPALHSPKDLYFPTQEIARDVEGGLRSPVALSEGLTYTVVSDVPYRDRTRLSRASKTVPPRIQNYYLQVPDAIADRVRQATQAILATSPKPITAPSEQALYLAQYLKQNYTIQLDLPFLTDQEDLVEAFLFKYKGGYPDHFSTTLTMMLRSIGIPARLVVGFAPGEFNPFTGFYLVRNTDAFAMTEVYFNRYGWFAFDPIPGHETVPPSIEESQVFGVLRHFWNWVAGWLPSPITGLLNYVFGRVAAGIAWAIAFFTVLFSNGWNGILAGLGLLTGLGFVSWLGYWGWRNWQEYRWLTSLPPMEALYQQMLRSLSTQGFPKPPAQTPSEYAHHLQNHQPSAQWDAVQQISEGYVSWRYGGQTPDVAHLRQQLRRLQKKGRSS